MLTSGTLKSCCGWAGRVPDRHSNTIQTVTGAGSGCLKADRTARGLASRSVRIHGIDPCSTWEMEHWKRIYCRLAGPGRFRTVVAPQPAAQIDLDPRLQTTGLHLHHSNLISFSPDAPIVIIVPYALPANLPNGGMKGPLPGRQISATDAFRRDVVSPHFCPRRPLLFIFGHLTHLLIFLPSLTHLNRPS